ncbi:MAG: alpha/beta fold hydrolase [Candidatus Thiodiazotropha sp. (ex Ctena orbiculata)]|uniref:Alpha/beta fold hydrolase n=1 Tax=Candidatus Thiodiazotropha taylori TaxID=2792791 RepID=A0A944MAV9_9GAMM|nr:alpha/beta fold hydrolase [Candidatus Thiodiazotropha taylori]PUB81190.1 MAG: lipase [gamma proteobacterium symbiont of Ctena orbiculata]MBT2990493.1 alpha/beta fold hydrolase [Candidatus Thiodiazotropha taylori]MBT2998572.1 alpha/beta fold hydrolase [Candidatus Thiodiazotropha taylori]MBT3002746.1 alpha/beta fold hydrolase [Candidatus Thiodiazotropha taylori]
MRLIPTALLLLILILPSLSLAAEIECVVLLHGMGRTSFSMSAIEGALEDQGYQVWNQSYPGLSKSVEELTAPAIEAGLEFCRDEQAKAVHFVTHSLGGILVRYYLQDHRIADLGRIVMLAPPNRGSEVADEMKDGYWYRTIMGPSAQVLGTDENSLPNTLKPIPGEIGIIAGKVDGEPWFLPEIPGDDDGKVAVERTKLPEMKDFLLVEEGHAFIMLDDEVIRQVLYFLRHGEFDKSKPE